MKNYDDYYNDEELTEEELEEQEKEEKNQDKKGKKDRRKSNKKSSKHKKVVKKGRNKRPKKQVVYKEKDNSHSGILIFFLLLIVIGLAAILAYLYYTKDDPSNPINQMTNNKVNEEAKVCEATGMSSNVSSLLLQCDGSEFTMNLTDLNLSFDIENIGGEFSYKINNIYYDGKKVSLWGSKLNDVTVNNNWQIKTDSDLIYLLFKTSNDKGTDELIVLENGDIIYEGLDNTDYVLGSEVTYTTYTDLGLEEIDTCTNYEHNNESDEIVWEKGVLTYGDGIAENITEEVKASDVCMVEGE